MLEVSNKNSAQLLIAGDFNYPHIDWESHTGRSNTDIEFIDTIADCFLHQHVHFPSRHRVGQTDSTLDLVFTNNDHLIDDIESLPPLGLSDHLGLIFTITLSASEREAQFPKLQFSLGQYNDICEELDKVDWEQSIKDMDTEQSWSFFHTILTDIMKKNISCSSSQRRKKKHRWMNNQALKLHGLKHRAWQQAQVTEHPTDIARARRLAKALQCLTRELRSNFEKDLAKNVKKDPKAFWRYASDNLKTRKGLPDLKKTDGTFTSTDEEKAEILNAFFETTFTEEDTSSIPQLERRQSAGCLPALDITPEDVHRKLDLLSKFKSAGPDDIHPCILWETAPSVCTPLAIIYTKSFKEGKLPSAWKASHVVPVQKKGNKSEATNYRPISLT
ncbi:uncharacterized protein LOC121423522 [Lytechinus variegatus]|uniref:uncharacterized protein LOC121423522 n=1 Tax=Lytechinus variegatus TaxID=7654 RepID=UPI001BB297D1|nr:uncharacterized protein LOC121423522 [Lytechinus variegatus]